MDGFTMIAMHQRLLQRVFLFVLAIGLPLLPVLPVAPAEMNKVVRHVFPAAETGFDPQGIHDLYSGTVVQAIFETLLTYDYLARPSKLIPLTAESLPQITDDG